MQAWRPLASVVPGARSNRKGLPAASQRSKAIACVQARDCIRLYIGCTFGAPFGDEALLQLATALPGPSSFFLGPCTWDSVC